MIPRRLRCYLFSSSLLKSDINECVDDILYNCTDEFQTCVNTRGSYKCECDQGLYFIDGKCRGNHVNSLEVNPALMEERMLFRL